MLRPCPPAALQHFSGDAVLDLLLDVEYENFVLFSRTTMDGDVVSGGSAGNVFIQLELPQSRRRRTRPVR